MNAKNLWGDLVVLDEPTPPVTVLKHQADELSRLTNHILEGKVTLVTQGDFFLYDLDIVAPALDNYIYTILQVKHDVSLYPLTVVDMRTQKTSECKDEEVFVEHLRQTLSSSEVRKVISSLLSQSKAMPPYSLRLSDQVSW